MFDMEVKECFFFDAGDTLIYHYPSREGIMLDLLEDFGMKVTMGQMKVAFMINDDLLSVRGLTIMPEEDRAKFWRGYTKGLLDVIGKGHERLDEISKELVSRFGDPKNWRDFQEVKPTLDALKKDGCHLGIISNSQRRLRRILEELGLIDQFEVLIISEEVGVEKPDPRIFELALGQVGLPPEKCVHVGNMLDVDVKGARGAGITPVWLDRERLGKQIADMTRIGSLSDLPTVFRLPGIHEAPGDSSPL